MDRLRTYGQIALVLVISVALIIVSHQGFHGLGAGL